MREPIYKIYEEDEITKIDLNEIKKLLYEKKFIPYRLVKILNSEISLDNIYKLRLERSDVKKAQFSTLAQLQKAINIAKNLGKWDQDDLSDVF